MADTTNLLAGTAHLTVDGTTYLVAGDFAYQVSRVTRETLVGMDQVHGYSEKPVAGHVSASLRDVGGVKVSTINQMTNVSIVVELANGKTIIGRNMSWGAAI